MSERERAVSFEPIWERLRDKAVARKEAADKEPLQDGRCCGVTATGMRCSHTATTESHYCGWHDPARKRR